MAIPKYFTKPDKTASSQNEQSSLLWTHNLTSHISQMQNRHRMLIVLSLQRAIFYYRRKLIPTGKGNRIIGQRRKVQHNLISFFFFKQQNGVNDQGEVNQRQFAIICARQQLQNSMFSYLGVKTLYHAIDKPQYITKKGINRLLHTWGKAIRTTDRVHMIENSPPSKIIKAVFLKLRKQRHLLSLPFVVLV